MDPLGAYPQAPPPQLRKLRRSYLGPQKWRRDQSLDDSVAFCGVEGTHFPLSPGRNPVLDNSRALLIRLTLAEYSAVFSTCLKDGSTRPLITSQGLLLLLRRYLGAQRIC